MCLLLLHAARSNSSGGNFSAIRGKHSLCLARLMGWEKLRVTSEDMSLAIDNTNPIAIAAWLIFPLAWCMTSICPAMIYDFFGFWKQLLSVDYCNICRLTRVMPWFIQLVCTTAPKSKQDRVLQLCTDHTPKFVHFAMSRPAIPGF